jgi:hypothetical protein
MLDTWALDEGLVDLEGMVNLHLSTNFYPAFPHEWITAVTPAVMEAIVNASEDNAGEPVEWPITALNPIPRAAYEGEGGVIYIDSNELLNITHTWGLVS